MLYIDPDELLQLILAYQDHPSDEVRDKVWLAAHRIAREAARRLSYVPPGPDRDDVVQEATISVVRAVSDFERDRGSEVFSYLTSRAVFAFRSWRKRRRLYHEGLRGYGETLR